MKRGANTFPFHNLLPYSESNEGLFLFFTPSLNWITEKSVATLSIRNICDQKQNKSKVSSPTVLHLLCPLLPDITASYKHHRSTLTYSTRRVIFADPRISAQI